MNEIRRALDLDPLSVVINRAYGNHLFGLGQYDEALEQFRRILELDSLATLVHRDRGNVLRRKGVEREAFIEYVKEETLQGAKPEKLKQLEQDFQQAGLQGYFKQRAQELIEQSRHEYTDPVALAEACVNSELLKEAWHYLDRAIAERNPAVVELPRSPVFEPLRNDPQFERLVKQTGLDK